MRYPTANRKHQSGAALIVSLIFLLLMTLISTSSMRTATMQERMAGNMRDWNIGFQRAETSLRDAEEWLLDTNVLPEFNDAGGYYQLNSDARPSWESAPPSAGNGSIDYPGDGTPERRYYVERLSSVRPAGVSTETGTAVEEIYYFRITAVGYGLAVDDAGVPLTSVVLRSVYRSR
ncbi:MAG TPA: PilX N-terminal domain-containing pilus assembly protein [Woeseiaceae bacterium]|nr:PilX N-terminal domain-containing pilus assembly protein [Woeseiaceae bacterium]